MIESGATRTAPKATPETTAASRRTARRMNRRAFPTFTAEP
jgi:hypothetical protein